jgi:hypothetical protein
MWHSFHRTDLCGSRATSVSMGAVIAVCVAPEADCTVCDPSDRSDGRHLGIEVSLGAAELRCSNLVCGAQT